MPEPTPRWSDPPAGGRVEVLRIFVSAVSAVWRDIERREHLPGGYTANVLDEGTELRRAEKRAWQEYRHVVDIDGDPLDALLAEVERLRAALERIAASRPEASCHPGVLRCDAVVVATAALAVSTEDE